MKFIACTKVSKVISSTAGARRFSATNRGAIGEPTGEKVDADIRS